MVTLYNIFGKAVFHCTVLVGSLKTFSNGVHVHKTSLRFHVFIQAIIQQNGEALHV